MDQVREFKPSMPHTKPGLYYIEKQLYFPIRGNGWYSHAMITYLIGKELITTEDIKYVVYSSLSVPHDCFNGFIDEIDSIQDGYENLKVNSTIGSLKPSKRQNYKTLMIGTDPNVIYYHYLKAKASYINIFDIDGTTYYHIYEKYETKSEETETPIYNMSLELEIINLYGLYKEVERLGGTVHDVNVDCVICTFKDDKLPFTVNADGNVEGYFYDNENKVHKY
jgi:hypothetical protein